LRLGIDFQSVNGKKANRITSRKTKNFDAQRNPSLTSQCARASVDSRVVKADLFALLTSAHDESLGMLARAITCAPRRDVLRVRRTFVLASDVLYSRAVTRRIKRPR
jgi:hypothetical protein